MAKESTTIIPLQIKKNWKQKLNELSAKLEIPVAVIMQIEDPTVKVFITNDDKRTPYNVGDVFNLRGTYCEAAIDSENYYIVQDATSDPKWSENPALDYGLISYFGLPIRWANGEIFGTICLNDFETNTDWTEFADIVEEIRSSIEAQLAELYEKRKSLKEKKE